MKSMKSSLLFSLFLLSVSSHAQQQTESINPNQALLDKFKQHVVTLSSEEFAGRAPMTKGDTLAFTYILDQLKTMPNVELLGDKGLQTFGFAGLREYADDSTQMKINGKKLRINTDYTPSTYSWSGGFNGKVEYIGEGSPANFDTLDVKGKIVMIDHIQSTPEAYQDTLRKQIRAAEKAKVAGIVIATEELPTVEAVRYLSRTLSLVYVTPKTATLLKDGANVEYFAKIFGGKKKEKYTQNVVARIKAAPQHNPNNDCIVVGAHYDHMGITTKDGVTEINYGADDNATGIATLLELARYFSSHQDLLKRDIVFVAFGAEEWGLVGSTYFAEHPLVPLKSIKAMFNFDMTGRMEKNNLNIRGVGVVTEAFSHLSTLSNPNQLNLSLIMSGLEGTDYASFNRKGVPSMSFSTGIHKDYHSPLDTEDKINYDGMQRVYNFVLPLISRAAFEHTKFTKQ